MTSMTRTLATLHRILGLATPHRRWWIVLPWIVAAVVGVRAAQAQSLLEQPVRTANHGKKSASSQPPPAPSAPAGQPTAAPQSQAAAGDPPPPGPVQFAAGNEGPSAGAMGIESMSLFAVTPPTPKAWAKHDLVEVIVNESSIQKFQQVNDLKKNYSNQATLNQFPSLQALFTQLALPKRHRHPRAAFGVTNDNTYKGDAKINRTDQVTAKITAEVIDVKPNGTLVLEAKESIQTDKEISTMVLSGTCRQDDITKSNTVQSSQIAGLNIRIEHEGEVKTTAEKGLITRVLEAIFNF